MLHHLVRRIRRHWPRVAITVRADGRYCSEPALSLLEAHDCRYIMSFENRIAAPTGHVELMQH